MDQALMVKDYNNVLDDFNLLEDEGAKEISKKLYHYKRLQMKEAYEKQKEGAVAYVLNKSGFDLIINDRILRKFGFWGSPWGYILRKIYHDGTRRRIKNVWLRCLLKEYPHADVPFDLLKKLPDDAAEKTVVFYPRQDIDPILAYPLIDRNKLSANEKKNRIIRILKKECFVKASPYYVGLYQWE